MTETQQTLTGEPTNESRQRPSTLVTCDECGDVILRSERHDHPHDVFDYTGFTRHIKDPGPGTDDDDNDEPVEHIGDWYDIELNYSTSYTFRVPGYSRSDAEAVAKALSWDRSPHDRFHVHTDARKIKPIHSDDDETVERLENDERGV